jgi:hypothetical protein
MAFQIDVATCTATIIYLVTGVVNVVVLNHDCRFHIDRRGFCIGSGMRTRFIHVAYASC